MDRAKGSFRFFLEIYENFFLSWQRKQIFKQWENNNFKKPLLSSIKRLTFFSQKQRDGWFDWKSVYGIVKVHKVAAKSAVCFQCNKPT